MCYRYYNYQSSYVWWWPGNSVPICIRTFWTDASTVCIWIYGLNMILSTIKKSAVLICKSKYIKDVMLHHLKLMVKQSSKLIMWHIWVTLYVFLIHYMMTRTFDGNANNCVMGVVRCCGKFTCVPQKWSWLTLDLSALPCILLSCGGVTQ